MSDDPVVIAKRWKMTLAEEGGIGDILNSLQERYLKRMGEVERARIGRGREGG